MGRARGGEDGIPLFITQERVSLAWTEKHPEGGTDPDCGTRRRYLLGCHGTSMKMPHLKQRRKGAIDSGKQQLYRSLPQVTNHSLNRKLITVVKKINISEHLELLKHTLKKLVKLCIRQTIKHTGNKDDKLFNQTQTGGLQVPWGSHPESSG